MSEKAKLRTGNKNSFFGKTHSSETRLKQRLAKLRKPTKYWMNKKRHDMSDEKHFKWKGDFVGYHALHAWVTRKLGKANKCVSCDVKSTTYHWANKSGEYLRDVKDWLELCVRCHSRFDRGRDSIIKKYTNYKQKYENN
jgi:hypothetical protein